MGQARYKQRFQACVELIEALLACPGGQEGELLAALEELVDERLLAVMKAYAKMLRKKGNTQDARWLLGIVEKLKERLRTAEGSPSSSSSGIVAKFVRKIVRLMAQKAAEYLLGIAEKRKKRLERAKKRKERLVERAEKRKERLGIGEGNPLSSSSGNAAEFMMEIEQLIGQPPVDYSQVYAFFQTNVDRLNAELLVALPRVFADLVQQRDPVSIAAVFGYFGMFINHFPLGDRVLNLEMSILAYEQFLSVITQAAMPIEWATITRNLANAYSKRIKGDRAENIEQAIVAYEQALSVMTQSTMPIKWAQIAFDLANSYSDRIQGDRAENIEQAIGFYEQALRVMTEAAMPIEWATATNNLANAYAQRIKGDRGENIEQAIGFYEQALRVRTEAVMPIEWAQTTDKLATACAQRIKGDHGENIEQAIGFYEQALRVRTEAVMPIEWAQTTSNLANAYYFRIKDDRRENIEQAIGFYEQALKVRTEAAMPIEWAQTTMNLATAYSERIKGDSPAERLRHRGENIEQAIGFYEQALTVMTQAAMPIEWAQTTMNLAIAYSNRIKGDRGENIEQAIVNYRSSLTIFEPARLPNDCRRTSRSLANLYSDHQHWPEAIAIYDQALEAAEILYQSATLLDSKAASLSETADLPRRAAYAFAHTGDFSKAVLTLEQGRARGLSESLDRDRANLTELQSTNPNLYDQYQNTTSELRTLEIQQRSNSITPEELRNLGPKLRSNLEETINQIRQVSGYEDFLSPIKWENIQKAVAIDRPLVYLVTTPNGGMVLTVRVDAIEVLWLNDLKKETLQEILVGRTVEKELSRYLGAYQDFRNDSKANYQAWCEEIDTTTRQLWDLLMGPIVQQLKAKGFDRATLIPTGLLSLLPLHAAWTEDATKPTGKRYALDDIHFTYTPNVRSLTEARTISDRVKADSILAIDNPRQDLPNSEREINCAIDSFSDRTVLRHDEATIDAAKSGLAKAAIVHFSCHGTADYIDQPLNSGLLMSDGLLTLKDIFALNLAQDNGIRLAILSACETGLIGIDNADEAISLPTGLLQAGVAAVIASLWSVSDLSTMMLLTRFYDFWRVEGLEMDQALRQAQQWLRDTTNREKAAYFKAMVAAPVGVQAPVAIA